MRCNCADNVFDDAREKGSGLDVGLFFSGGRYGGGLMREGLCEMKRRRMPVVKGGNWTARD